MRYGTQSPSIYAVPVGPREETKLEIELGDAVAALREELLEAMARGVGQDVLFAVGPIEMEFTVDLRADAKAKTGFKAWVLSGDVEAGVAQGRTQRVQITMTPKRPGGGDVMISSQRGEGQVPTQPSGHIGR